MPVTARSFADPKTAPRLEYSVFLAKAGRYDIDLVTNPTLNINPAIQLGVAVAIDEGVPQIVRVFSPETRQSQDFLGRDYQANTEANARHNRQIRLFIQKKSRSELSDRSEYIAQNRFRRRIG